MRALSIIPAYFIWHYSAATVHFFVIWKNFLLFFYNFFSISDLSKTLFSGWKKMKENYPQNFNMGQFFSTLVINTIMIIFGLVVKSAVIVIGLFSILLSFSAGLVIFAAWLLMPFLAVSLFYLGIIKIF